MLVAVVQPLSVACYTSTYCFNLARCCLIHNKVLALVLCIVSAQSLVDGSCLTNLLVAWQLSLYTVYSSPTTTTILRPFVQDYPVPEETFTHTYPDHQPSFISFLHMLRSMMSFPFNLCAWQSFCATSAQVLFGLPLGLAPSTSCSIHFFTQLLPYFYNTCPYHHNMFCCSTEIMSSNPRVAWWCSG